MVEALEGRRMLAVTLELSGTQTITPGDSINVSNQSGAYQSEMSVDINPTNPLNLAGFTHRIVPFGIDYYDVNQMDVFYSLDGGLTWTTNTIDEEDDGYGTGMRFDPTIAFDANGNLFIGYGFANDVGPEYGTRLIVARSTDGGASFSQFRSVDYQANVIVPGDGVLPGVDKWVLATGRDPSSGNEAVYIAYTQNALEGGAVDQRIVVSGSNDGGDTFTSPLIINDASIAGANEDNIFADPALGPNGELYVSWYDYLEPQVHEGRILLDRDVDGLWGNSSDFGTDIMVEDLMRMGLSDSFVPAQPQRGIDSAPVLAVDRSAGTYNGQLYIAFAVMTETFNTTRTTELRLARSSDQGATWTAANIGTNTATEFLPWVAVDQTSGSVHVSYLTTDDGTVPPPPAIVRPRLASSIDGGSTFVRADLTTMTSSEYGGWIGDYLEYMGLAARDGTAHVLWATRHGAGNDLDAYTTSVSFVSGANTLMIEGTGGADTILVRRSSVNSAFLEVMLNGVREYAGLYATVAAIVINSGGGNDTVTIDSAVTIPLSIDAGDGNDTVTAVHGDDSLIGGAGNDTYVFGSGAFGTVHITEEANGGTDTLDFYGFGQGVTVDLAKFGTEKAVYILSVLSLYLSDESSIENVKGSNNTSTGDSFHGNSLNNTFWGNAGNDTFFGGADSGTGADVFYGGAGVDTADYSQRTGGVGVSLDNNANDGAAGEYDNVHSDIERIIAGSGNDTLFGTGAPCTLTGGDGNDVLAGGGGNDELWAGPGNDTVYGGIGHDSIYGEEGMDHLDGGTAYGGYGGVDDYGNDYIQGGDDSDVIYGDYGDDELYGESQGASTGAGDYIWGDEGNDSIFGGPGNDYAYGGHGNDTIEGDDGNDFIHGNDGNDTIKGGDGSDQLYGDAGDDRFNSSDWDLTRDTVDGGDGTDRLALWDDPEDYVEPDTIELFGL